MSINAASTIRQLQDRQGELLRERESLLLELAEARAELEGLRYAKSQALQIIGRSNRRNASASFCRHLLTCVENTLSETRRAA